MNDLDCELISAAMRGDLGSVGRLLKSGANVHFYDDWALRLASKYGHIRVVEVLLKSGADVHAQDDQALRLASTYEYVGIVELLLKAGACGGDMLCSASDNGSVKVVETLLKAGADVHTRYDESLRLASDSGHIEVVKLLLEAGADVHACCDESLRWACEHSHSVGIVAKLVEAGASLKALQECWVYLFMCDAPDDLIEMNVNEVVERLYSDAVRSELV